MARTLTLLTCALDLVVGFSQTLTGRSSIVSCPDNKCLMADGQKCGKYFDPLRSFCYSRRGMKRHCNDYRQACQNAPTSGSCTQYRRWVDQTLQCPNIPTTEVENKFCMTEMKQMTDVTGTWCYQQPNKIACENSYFKWPVDGRDGYYQCVYDERNEVCTPEARGDNAEYQVVTFCAASCSAIKADDAMLPNGTTCSGPAGLQATARLLDKDTCESAYYEVTTPQTTAFPCVYQADTFTCRRDILCPDIPADQPCIAACNCVASSPGCKNEAEQCCKNDASGMYTCVNCADIE